MTTAAQLDRDERRERRKLAWYAALGLGLLIALIATTGRGGDQLPLDPDSTASDGLRGLVEVLGQLGVDVEVSASLPIDKATRLFVPLDVVRSDQRAEITDWVEAGGTLVVTGADAPLHGLTPAGSGFVDVLGATGRVPTCEVPTLTSVGEVRHASWSMMEVPDGATGCFPADSEGTSAWLVVEQRGAGMVVALGSAAPLTNGQLDQADNAVLAAALLGPEPGDRLVIVPRPAVGEGDTPLLELVPAGFWRLLTLLGFALVVTVVWLSRRLGPPVAERLPPVLPSAELARSVADLLQRAGDRGSAADRLRADIRHEVARVLGSPPASRHDHLADLAVARLGLDPVTARRALVDAPVADDRALTDLAAAVARVRGALHRPTSTPTVPLAETGTVIGSSGAPNPSSGSSARRRTRRRTRRHTRRHNDISTER